MSNQDPYRFARPGDTVPCRYCGETVEADFDGEGGYWFFPVGGAHWACVWEDRQGEWIVRTTQNAVTPPRVHEDRYGTQARAREKAAEIRRHNLREWPCGRQLDIVVVRQPVPVGATS